jgi:hypothetical protein
MEGRWFSMNGSLLKHPAACTPLGVSHGVRPKPVVIGSVALGRIFLRSASNSGSWLFDFSEN